MSKDLTYDDDDDDDAEIIIDGDDGRKKGRAVKNVNLNNQVRVSKPKKMVKMR